MYVGILRSGETRSEIFPELQIITPDQFARVEKGREQRSAVYEQKCEAAWQQEVALADGGAETVNRPPRIYPKRNGGRTLLSGNIYCGHCGGRLFASTAAKTHHPKANGLTERVPIYKCYNRSQHRELCNGPSTYRAEKVDRLVEALIRGIFERAKSVNEQELVKHQVQVSVQQSQQKLRRAKTDYAKAASELAKWESLMLDSIEGTSVFTPEQVKKRMDAVQKMADELLEEIDTLQEQAEQSRAAAAEIQEQHQRLLSWAGMFDDASPEEKKVIASYILRAVTVSRNYDIKVEFNISEAQYLGGMEMNLN